MPRPRRKPFWRWAPLPWAVLLLLMLTTGTMQDLGLRAAYLTLIVVTVLSAAGFAAVLVVAGRRRGRNFTAEGHLARIEGLELVEVPRVGHPITVYGTERHQTGIDAACARSARPPGALLVPDAGNWWSLRSDVAVYLVAPGSFHLVGRLGDHAQVAWQGVLDGLRREGRYALVPAEVREAGRRRVVDVRLEALKTAAPATQGLAV